MDDLDGMAASMGDKANPMLVSPPVVKKIKGNVRSQTWVTPELFLLLDEFESMILSAGPASDQGRANRGPRKGRQLAGVRCLSQDPRRFVASCGIG